MAGATAERTTLDRIRESTWAETPSNPLFQRTRYTGESLSNSITTSQSEEIRENATVSDITVTDASVGGGIDFELSFGSYDDLFEAALRGTWSNVALSGVSMTLSTNANDNLTTAVPSAFLNVQVGSVIRLNGFTNPANNRLYRVTEKADNTTLTLFPVPAAAGTSSADLVSDTLLNGTNLYSYSILKTFNDASPVARQLYRGMRVNGFTLEMATGGMITGSWDFLGSTATWLSAAIPGSNVTAATVTPVMNAVSHITDITMDNVGLCATGAVQNLTLEVSNNLREQKGLCRLGAVGIALGQFNATVSGSQYFENDVEAKKFEDAQDFEFSLTLQDGDGNIYVFTLFRAKYETFEANATGLGTDVVAGTAFIGLDGGNGRVLMINRISASPGGGS